MEELDNMNILLASVSTGENLGDKAIGRTLEKYYSESGHTVIVASFCPVDEELTIAGLRVKFTERENIIRKQNKLKLFLKKIPIAANLFRNLKNYLIEELVRKRAALTLSRNCREIFRKQHVDVVIIGGGQLIKGRHHIFSACMDFWTRRFKGVPVCVVGVGCDENFTARDVRIYRRALKRCR